MNQVTCTHVHEALLRQSEISLSPENTDPRVLQHLSTCEECSALLADLQLVEELLASHAPGEPVLPPDFHDSLVRRLDQEPHPSLPVPTVVPVPQPATVSHPFLPAWWMAVAALLLLAPALFLLRPDPREVPTVTRLDPRATPGAPVPTSTPATDQEPAVSSPGNTPVLLLPDLGLTGVSPQLLGGTSLAAKATEEHPGYLESFWSPASGAIRAILPPRRDTWNLEN